METTTGTKAVVWGTIGSELLLVVYDLRWMVIFSVVLILADMWWGYSESKKRKEDAKEKGSAALEDKYKWRKSRAVRRTANKAVDYLTYLIVGAFFGLAITEPMDLCDHVWTAAIGLGIGCACEIASIVGHIAYVKMGVEISLADAWRAIVRFLGRLIKVRSQEIGEAVEGLGRRDDDMSYGDYSSNVGNEGTGDYMRHGEGIPDGYDREQNLEY